MQKKEADNLDILPPISKKKKRGDMKDKKQKTFENSLNDMLTAWINGEDFENKGSLLGIDVLGVDCIRLPVSLSAAQRRLAHEICMRLDLFHKSIGDGDNRQLVISKTETFGDDDQSDSVDKSESSIWYSEYALKPILKSFYVANEPSAVTELRDLTLSIVAAPGGVDEMATLKIAATDLTKTRCLETFMEEKAGLTSAQFIQEHDSSAIGAVNIGVGGVGIGSSSFVNTPNALNDLCGILRGQSFVGFDLEMHSFRSYHGITCLIQLSMSDGRTFIVDPLPPDMWSSIGRQLGPVFRDPAIVKIGHGIMGGDVPALFRDFGIVVVNAFDTQVAAESLGISSVGLAALLRHWGLAHITEFADRKDRMRNADWRLRPLTDEMRSYASQDVQYLIPLCLVQIRSLLLMAIPGHATAICSSDPCAKTKPGTKYSGKTSSKTGDGGKEKVKKEIKKAKLDQQSLKDDAFSVHRTLIQSGTGSGKVESNAQALAGDDEADDALVWGESPEEGGAQNYPGDDDIEEEPELNTGEDAGDDNTQAMEDAELDEQGMAADDEDEDLWDGWGEEAASGAGPKTEAANDAAGNAPQTSAPLASLTAINGDVGTPSIKELLTKQAEVKPIKNVNDADIDSSFDKPLSDQVRRGRVDAGNASLNMSVNKSNLLFKKATTPTTERTLGAAAEKESGADDQTGPAPAMIDSIEESAYLNLLISDYSDGDGETVRLTATHLQRDARLTELLSVLAASQQCCAKLWTPKKISENAHTKVNGYSQRLSKKGGRTQVWTEKNVFVFRRLYGWRVEEAQARDESSSYICPSSLLLNAAEYLPTTAEALLKLSSPLPASMRPQSQGQSQAQPQSVGVSSPVDLVAAVRSALDAWHAENPSPSPSSDLRPAVTGDSATTLSRESEDSKRLMARPHDHNRAESDQVPTIDTDSGSSNIVLSLAVIVAVIGAIGIVAGYYNRKRDNRSKDIKKSQEVILIYRT